MPIFQKPRQFSQNKSTLWMVLQKIPHFKYRKINFCLILRFSVNNFNLKNILHQPSLRIIFKSFLEHSIHKINRYSSDNSKSHVSFYLTKRRSKELNRFSGGCNYKKNAVNVFIWHKTFDFS